VSGRGGRRMVTHLGAAATPWLTRPRGTSGLSGCLHRPATQTRYGLVHGAASEGGDPSIGRLDPDRDPGSGPFPGSHTTQRSASRAAGWRGVPARGQALERSSGTRRPLARCNLLTARSSRSGPSACGRLGGCGSAWSAWDGCVGPVTAGLCGLLVGERKHKHGDGQHGDHEQRPGRQVVGEAGLYP